jgi:hypothetical protein
MTTAIVVARTAIVRIAGDCPNTAVVEVGAIELEVGYTPCGT